MLAAERLGAVDIRTPRMFHVKHMELAAVAGPPAGTRLTGRENWRFRP